MKYIFALVLLFSSLTLFAQEKKSIKSGYITFNSGTTLEFKNLVIDGDNITYLSGSALQETKISKNGIKKIVDNSGTIIYESGKVNEIAYNNKAVVNQNPGSIVRQDNEKLVYKSADKIMLDGKRLTDEELGSLLKPAGMYNNYIKEWNNAYVGTIMIGGGIGLFVGGGVSNLINANKGKAGSPAVLIIGLATTAIGIPIKIGGTRKIKDVVNRYNSLPVKSTAYYERTELEIIGNANGVGFQLKF